MKRTVPILHHFHLSCRFFWSFFNDFFFQSDVSDCHRAGSAHYALSLFWLSRVSLQFKFFGFVPGAAAGGAPRFPLALRTVGAGQSVWEGYIHWLVPGAGRGSLGVVR